jgi:hypothetical protein
LISSIAERLPEFVDGHVEAMFEVTGSRSGPKTIAKILTAYQLAGPIQQLGQNLARLQRKLDSVTVLPQFQCRRVEFEWPKSRFRRSERFGLHLVSPG